MSNYTAEKKEALTVKPLCVQQKSARGELCLYSQTTSLIIYTEVSKLIKGTGEVIKYRLYSGKS